MKRTERPTGDAHRRIWVKHHGPIPFDDDGVRCEIHHIDGDPTNNDITNLICLTVHEHYEIHFWQGDWRACLRMSAKLSLSPEQMRELGVGDKHHNYDHTIHSFINMRTREIVHDTRFNFATMYDLDHKKMGALLAEKRWNIGEWRLLKNADKTTGKNSTESHLVYRWRNEHTGEIVEMTRKQLSERYDLNLPHVLSVSREKRRSVGGWMLATDIEWVTYRDCNRDHTIYRWRNTLTEEIVDATRSEMKSRGITKGAAHRLIHNKIKSSLGWVLVRE